MTIDQKLEQFKNKRIAVLGLGKSLTNILYYYEETLFLSYRTHGHEYDDDRVRGLRRPSTLD